MAALPATPQTRRPRAPGRPSDLWRIGEPDFVFEMPEPYVGSQRHRLDEYQYYRVPANFPEDRYIQAIELRPGNKSVVHHMGAIIGASTLESMNANQALLKLYGLTGDKDQENRRLHSGRSVQRAYLPYGTMH